MQSPLRDFIATCRRQVESALDACLPGADINPCHLHEAMRYAVLDGGKRVRATLVYGAGQAVGVADLDALNPAACAVELIHAYSLVHDDLPCMDDDDLRRGKPSCHRAFDEATALLAGDALQALAFYAIGHGQGTNPAGDHRLEMLETLALASGSRGMAGGQAIDLASVGKTLDLTELENMHIHKTGALIRASVKLGALTRPDVDRTLLTTLDHYAKCIGLSFQIRDDILDVEGDTETLGKPRGADVALNKPTYPALVGLGRAKAMARDLHQQAMESLTPLGSSADPLRWLSEYIVERPN